MAHGRLGAIDVAAAEALPGVRRVLTYHDLRPLLTCDRIPLAMPGAAIRFDVDPFVLARDEVCHVGDPIALVVADSRHIAEDALGLIGVEIDSLPAIVDPRAGLAPDAPQARLDCPDNLVARMTAQYGDVDRAFAGAAHVVTAQFHLHKGGGHSIETRGLVARFDPGEDLLTVWDGTQMPHQAKRVLVRTLGLDETQVRVVAPDVGGGFGRNSCSIRKNSPSRRRRCCCAPRSNGSRTGSRTSPRRRRSVTSSGTSQWRPMRRAGCSA